LPSRSWSDAELKALAGIPPNDRAALLRYRAEFPGHSAREVSAKLLVLRVRGSAKDFRGRLKAHDPFPKYRELTDRGTSV
jgi:hypothetical protein